MAQKRISVKLEFIFRASPTIIYQFLTTPACLVRWFCDEVDIVGSHFNFIWSGEETHAELIEDWEDELLRFVWEDSPTEFLEFSIQRSPITNETVLYITDFCDANETKDLQKLWDTQVERLRNETGG